MNRTWIQTGTIVAICSAIALGLLSSGVVASEADSKHDQRAEDGAGDGDAQEVLVEPRQAVVQVNGVVCSFCAYGAEKALSELDCVDTSRFGDGVLIDVEKHRITLALASGYELPVRDVYQRIKKAGYDPVTFYLRLSGTIERREGTVLLQSSGSGDLYALMGDEARDLRDSGTVDVQVHLDAAAILSLEKDSPMPVVVDRLYQSG